MNIVSFDIPIALIIYNRPEKLLIQLKVLEIIKPNKLFIISDGPKAINYKDEVNVNECRQLISSITWECDIKKNYSEINLGLHDRIVSGLDWLFSIEEKAIILEDDTIPNISFFEFCRVNLLLYEKSKQVQLITGCNIFHDYTLKHEYDYFFLHTSVIWGWATWRTTWDIYSQHNIIWKKRTNRLILLFKYYILSLSILSTITFYRTNIKLYSNRFYTWDYQLQNVAIFYNWYCIVPKFNLVKNIGFDSGTNYNNKSNIKTFNPTEKITEFNLLKHPPKIRNFYKINRIRFLNTYPKINVLKFLKVYIKTLIRKLWK